MFPNAVVCLCVLIVPLFSSQAMAASPGNLKCTITDSGEFTAETVETVIAPETSSGAAAEIDKVRFTTRSNIIPAKLGVNFGFRFTVSGLPANSQITLRKVVTHPEMRRPDGVVSKGCSRDINYTSTGVGTLTPTVGYGFDHPFELLAGKWRLELWYGDYKCAEQTCDVVKQ